MSGPEDFKLGGRHNAGDPEGRRVMREPMTAVSDDLPPLAALMLAADISPKHHDFIEAYARAAVERERAKAEDRYERLCAANAQLWEQAKAKPIPIEACHAAVDANFDALLSKAEPVGYVVGWHVNAPTALHHADVRLDVKLYGEHHQFKAGDHIYAHPPATQPEQPDKVCQEDDGCPTELAVLQRFWRAHPPASEWNDVLAFLKGEGPLEGVHFGEPHPSGKPYWWRKYLGRLKR